MKRIFIFLLILPIVFSLVSCVMVEVSAPAFEKIATYKDIPGITPEEMDAIEALKAGRDSFSFGMLPSTEMFVLPDGSYAGFVSKYCQLLTGLFGIDFTAEIYDWDELIEKLDSCAVDFTGELTPTNERMIKYCMTTPIAERLLRIFTNVNSDVLRAETDVDGLKIGFLEDTVTAESITKVYPALFTRVEVENYHAAADMLRDGMIDAFVEEAVADPAFDEYDFIRSAIFFPMIHAPVSMTTANPKLAPVISAMNKYIDAGGADVLYRLYQEGDFEYSRHKLHKSFTDEERAYLDDLAQRGAPVRVAYEHDNYPADFYNQNENRFEGIALDVLAEISRLTGIKFTPATTKDSTWPEIFEKLKAGEIPMAAQLLYSKSRDENENLIWSAVPYARAYYAIMSKSEYPNVEAYQVSRAAVGVMRDSGFADIYRELFPENNNLVEYDTQNDCLAALEKGEVDLLMASEYMLLTETNYRENPGFKINVRLNAPMDSYFGFYKDEKVLASIIDKAQYYVQTDDIEAGWTGRVFDYAKKLAEERARYMTAFVCMLSIILLIALLLLIKNIKLSKELKEIASKDALTNILNRRYFTEYALIQLERSFRTGRLCFIIIFDLDHFKSVNDNYGHIAGDEVLFEVAQRVKKIIRPYDLFGRYGGEEFIILMPEINKENVIAATERIRQALCREPIEFENMHISISASFGIAYAAPVNDMHTATKCADEALYRAKEEGRNRVIFYEENDNA